MTAPPRGGTKKNWNVAVNAPLRGTFTYTADSSLELFPGTAIKVPFGKKNREVKALIINEQTEAVSQEFETKEIIGIDDERPPLSAPQLKWLQWLSDYYIYPLGQIQNLVYPPLKKKSLHKSRKEPVVPDVATIIPPPLTEEQLAAVNTIKTEQGGTYLLHGVTGSGKTEVYIEVIEKVIAAGKAALVLVPRNLLNASTCQTIRPSASQIKLLSFTRT